MNSGHPAEGRRLGGFGGFVNQFDGCSDAGARAVLDEQSQFAAVALAKQWNRKQER